MTIDVVKRIGGAMFSSQLRTVDQDSLKAPGLSGVVALLEASLLGRLWLALLLLMLLSLRLDASFFWSAGGGGGGGGGGGMGSFLGRRSRLPARLVSGSVVSPLRRGDIFPVLGETSGGVLSLSQLSVSATAESPFSDLG